MKKIGVCIILFFAIIIFTGSCFAEEKQQQVFLADINKSEDTPVASVCHVEYICELTGLKMETKPMSPELAQRCADDFIRNGVAAYANKVCK